MEFANTNRVLTQMGNEAIRQAQINLNITRTRNSYRIKWRKQGKDWQVLGFQKVKKKGKINSSGDLSKSLSFDINIGDAPNITMISSVDYADEVNEGTAPRRKQPPIMAMRKYQRQKPVRPRVFKDGKPTGFAKNTEKNKAATAFLIGRKIKHFGTEPTRFMDRAFIRASEQYEDDLVKAIVEDLNELIIDL